MRIEPMILGLTPTLILKTKVRNEVRSLNCFTDLIIIVIGGIFHQENVIVWVGLNVATRHLQEASLLNYHVLSFYHVILSVAHQTFS